MSNIDRITELEMQLAHTTRLCEELSDVVADQAGRIDKLERKLLILSERAATEEANRPGSVVLGDQRPPHW